MIVKGTVSLEALRKILFEEKWWKEKKSNFDLDI